MKKLLTTATAFALLAGAAHAEGKLSVYHWFEYIPQELVDKFTAETGIEVTIDTYDSNESMLASLKAGKMGQYDVAVPGDYMVAIMAGEGLLDQYDRQRRAVAERYLQAQTIANKQTLEERDPAQRAARQAEMRATAADPGRARQFLRRTAMIEGLQAAAAID